jgi:3-phytase
MMSLLLRGSGFCCLSIALASCMLDEPLMSPTDAVVVYAQAETEPVLTLDDAADDPAIWVNVDIPDNSRVLGTDKDFGLEVYDLSGKRLQRIASGRTNNVDLRRITSLPGWSALAAASNRTRNSVSLFLIADSGDVVWLERSEIKTGLAEPYGLCMFASDVGLQVFVNDKDGRYQQWLLHSTPMREGQPQFDAQLLREFSVPSQPEGCTVDDEQQRLFLGVEDEGVRTVSANHLKEPQLSVLADIDGAILAADVEGMDLFISENGAGYLIVSSQGNFSYAVYDRMPPHQYRGSFVVADNIETGIDGSQETDGLAVSSVLRTAQFPDGLLVVQDGFNTLPSAAQNFKYVSWEQVSAALKLP